MDNRKYPFALLAVFLLMAAASGFLVYHAHRIRGNVGVAVAILIAALVGAAWAGHLIADPSRTAERPLHDGNLGLSSDPTKITWTAGPAKPLRHQPDPASIRPEDVGPPRMETPPPSRMQQYFSNVNAPHPDSIEAAIGASAVGPIVAVLVFLALHPDTPGLAAAYWFIKVFGIAEALLLGFVVGHVALRLRWTFRRRHKQAMPLVCTGVAFGLIVGITGAIDRWLPGLLDETSIWMIVIAAPVSGYLIAWNKTLD